MCWAGCEGPELIAGSGVGLCRISGAEGTALLALALKVVYELGVFALERLE